MLHNVWFSFLSCLKSCLVPSLGAAGAPPPYLLKVQIIRELTCSKSSFFSKNPGGTTAVWFFKVSGANIWWPHKHFQNAYRCSPRWWTCSFPFINLPWLHPNKLHVFTIWRHQAPSAVLQGLRVPTVTEKDLGFTAGLALLSNYLRPSKMQKAWSLIYVYICLSVRSFWHHFEKPDKTLMWALWSFPLDTLLQQNFKSISFIEGSLKTSKWFIWRFQGPVWFAAGSVSGNCPRRFAI